ncbi:MAG TPA: hypothetical protein VET65_02840 [Candidatus Limnocylindrales bacterium]|nr:hypothetical protein [Candidatus Limnocylindrales bacterium]
MSGWLRRRIRLTWALLAVGSALALSLLWGTLLLATDHTRDAGMAAAAAAYDAAVHTRSTALAAHGMHPVIWDVPPQAARDQLQVALVTETRFSEEVSRIAFPVSVHCDVSRVLAATEQVKAAELTLIQQSYAGQLTLEGKSAYLDTIAAWGSADYTLRQDLGLAARLPLVNWWPSYC